MASALRFVFGIETKMNQRIVAFAGFHDDVAAATPVAAGGPPRGTNFSPRKAMQPLPPLPALIEFSPHR